MDATLVTELYVPFAGKPGGRVGSGYRVAAGLVLTAAHVVADLPTWPADTPVPPALDAPGACRARMLHRSDWAPAVVAWRSQDADVAVLRLDPHHAALPGMAASRALRWGQVDGTEQIAVTAVGFPWAQERLDRVRDTEQLFGFIAPATTVKSGLCAVTVQSTPPADRSGGSPWAGMSGAALFAGTYLLGVVIVDPARFGPGRIGAAPVAPLLGNAELASLLGTDARSVAGVGPRFRLAVTADVSIALAPPYRAPTPGMGRQPARLLLPEYGIVPFAGRTSDLDALQAWCLADSAPPLRVITGSGGSGKTRLAAEICVRMVGLGWQAGVADADAPGGRAELEFDRPTLLVVDDADLKATLLAQLIDVAGDWTSGVPPFRMLLLARHTTGWWQTLNQRTQQLADEMADDPPLTLQEGELAPADRAEHHARAVAAFSTWLSDPADLSGQDPPSLGDAAFANPLLVHMHALLAVTGAHVPTTGDRVRERALAAVLGRERNRWDASFPDRLPTGGTETRHQAVTLATLLAPATRTAAAQAMAVIEEFGSDAAAGARAAVASWLRDLYPGDDPPWIAALRPDLLAEQLLASCPQLSELTLAGYESAPSQAGTILAELTRAGGRASVLEALTGLLNAHLPDLLDAAIDSPASGLADLLDLALTLSPQPATAARIASRLPERTTSLAALALTVVTQATWHYRELTAARPAEFTAKLAAWLTNLSNRLGDVGRPEEALAAVEEAVPLRRQLAAEQPAVYEPFLALTLNNLSNRLADVGREADALAAIEEAVALRRQQAAEAPEQYAADLAMALNNLSIQLARARRPEDALAAIEESVRIRRQLAADQPDKYTADLGTSLNNLSTRMTDLRRAEDALAAGEEAVRLRRRLAEARPDAYTPDLAMSLYNLSADLGAVRRLDEALASMEEAVRLRRQLAAALPDAYLPDLAGSVHNLAILLSNAGRDDDALAAIEEAVTIRRQLVARRPAAHTPGLAASLTVLAIQLGTAGRREDALTAADEAVTIRRQLAAARPDAYTSDLASSLTTLAIQLGTVGRDEDALAAIEDSVTLYRQLVAARPDAHTPNLAGSLSILSIRLSEMERPQDALAAVEEAVAAYRLAAVSQPQEYVPSLAKCLLLCTTRQTDVSRNEPALATGREAVALFRQLYDEDPDAYRDGLKGAIEVLASDLRTLDRNEEADAAMQELSTLT